MKAVSVWRNRDFMLLWLGNGASLLGTNSARIAYPLLTLAVTGSPVAAGWVTFAGALPNILVQLPAGLNADTRNRRRTMAICQAGGLATAAVLVTLGMLDVSWFLPAVITLVFIEGCFFVFFQLAEMAAIRDVVQEDQRPTALSLYEAQSHATVLFARAVGVILYGAMRWLPFLGNLVSYAVATLTLSMVDGRRMNPVSDPDTEDSMPSRGLRQGVTWLWHEPFLRITNFLFGATNVLWQCIILLFIVSATQDDQPAWVLGLLLSSSGIGGLVGATVASHVTSSFSARRVFVFSLWGWALCATAVAATHHPAVQGIAWFGVGSIGALSGVAVGLYRVNATPPQLLGQVTGASGILPNGAIPLGGLLAGYLLAAFGSTTTAWALAGVMLALAVTGTALLVSMSLSSTRSPKEEPWEGSQSTLLG
ncbi:MULTISPECIES: MFS transporter [Streptomyces]|uniref:MFS transporter n=1 Tax=Streptomyces sp. 900129855 TaxID=3155129 RepID=A0ABV2ZH40_9ACTN